MNGLTTKTARERLKQDGENELAAAAKRRPLHMFLGQFRDVMVLILLAATGISAFLGEITDAVTIILIVLLNAILGFLQEYRTEQTLESLRNLTAPTATACRDGKWQTIPARELVCGDLVRLEAGDNVPADSTLIQAAGLAVNESILTGESEAVSKQKGPADTRNDLHKHNIVTPTVPGGASSGHCHRTRTQMGQISTMLQEVRQEMTPLQKRLAGLGKSRGSAAPYVCGAVFCRRAAGEPVFDMLMIITIAIAAIPGAACHRHHCPALAVSRMMKHGALVNRLHSVETLGCASVICSDKTGTITENRMTVTAIVAGGERFSVTGTGLQKAGAIQLDGSNVNPLSKPALRELLTCGSLAAPQRSTARRKAIPQPRQPHGKGHMVCHR
ncbi:MAG: HAD-IC family P-type ATPase [Ruminococcus callidus]